MSLNGGIKTQLPAFTAEDVAHFARVSGDYNAVHTDHLFVYRSPLEAPIVHGVLQVLSAIQSCGVSLREITSVVAEFARPLIVGESVTLNCQHLCEGQLRLETQNGSHRHATILVMLESGIQTEGITRQARPEARQNVGPNHVQRQGLYKAELISCNSLMHHGLSEQTFTASLVQVLLCMSFVSGSLLPGTGCILSRLHVTLVAKSSLQGQLSYSFVADNFEAGNVQVTGEIKSGELAIAHVEYSGFKLGPLPGIDLGLFEGCKGVSSLRGKRVFVTGGSRGLGRALTTALSICGCHVYAGCFQNSHLVRETVTLLQQKDLPSDIQTITGDIGDPRFCKRAAEQIVREDGGLDFLICNAFPKGNSCGLESAFSTTIYEHIQSAVRLTLAPLVTLAPILTRPLGSLVYISSRYVSHRMPGFAHYSAAKAMCESLITELAAGYGLRSTIFRPSRILTDQTNWPHLRNRATRAEYVALQIVERLTVCSNAPTAQIIEIPL